MTRWPCHPALRTRVRTSGYMRRLTERTDCTDWTFALWPPRMSIMSFGHTLTQSTELGEKAYSYIFINIVHIFLHCYNYVMLLIFFSFCFARDNFLNIYNPGWVWTAHPNASTSYMLRLQMCKFECFLFTARTEVCVCVRAHSSMCMHAFVQVPAEARGSEG